MRLRHGKPFIQQRVGNSTITLLDQRVFKYERQLNSAAREHAWARALAILQEIRDLGFTASGGCCSSALAALTRSGHWPKALRVFDRFLRESHETAPSQSCCNAAIGAAARGSNWALALALVQQMLDPGPGQTVLPAPDAVSYSAAVDACARASRWERVLKLLQDAMQHCRSGPNAAAVGAAMGAMERAGQWQRALPLLAWARSQHLTFHVAVLNAAMGALGSGGRWDQVLQLLATMQEEGPSPNTISFNTSIAACGAAGQWVEALKLFGNMQEKQLMPTTITFTTLISAYANAALWEEAVEQLSELKRRKLPADVVCYNAALTACGRSLRWTSALELMCAIQQQAGVTPNITTYNTALGAFAVGEAWEEAVGLLARLQQERLHPDHVTYRAGMAAIVRGAGASSTEAALRFHREAEDAGLLNQTSVPRQVVDFHELTVEAATTVAAACLLRGALEGGPDLVFVVGRGAGSLDGERALAPALQAYLQELRPVVEAQLDPDNDGRLHVSAASVQSWAQAHG
eukprot:TRINITY_DN6766_c0_g2_i1.p1 TRINITY_DN6766_c0_g2~~TRINITY_DN6766_c0_g2_i1.p1  ORF type:complete len:520 (+),score=112.87 TRINITY_DN6766_c0_g2_i1:70-1629(+)